jgi:hypothetical protein
MNNESENIWNKSAVAYLEVLSRNLPGETDETHENLIQSSRFSGRDLKAESPDYEAGELTTRTMPRHSMSGIWPLITQVKPLTLSSKSFQYIIHYHSIIRGVVK